MYGHMFSQFQGGYTVKTQVFHQLGRFLNNDVRESSTTPCPVQRHGSGTPTPAEMARTERPCQPATSPASLFIVLAANHVSWPVCRPRQTPPANSTVTQSHGQEAAPQRHGTLASMRAHALPPSSSFPGSTLRVRQRQSSDTADKRKAAR